MKPFVIIWAVVFLSGCSSINYSQLSPDSKHFHPRTIAVLPATIGEHESSREVVENAVSSKLVKTKWFSNVVDAGNVKSQMIQSGELSDSLGKYIQQLNTLGVSDPNLSEKLRESLSAEALFLTYVTSWGYGRQDGNKVARVGLGVKLIDSSKGTVIWKANHELIEEYTIFKPKLANLTDDLLTLLFKEMPH
ncbi:MAG: hypothetical protein HY200_07555 [Nitrospirae bacterium]|nr:hypothetical protein [Nitrospirota bacterium]MBI3594800.1 hypothetical protein [Nitrospirota bacterium]